MPGSDGAGVRRDTGEEVVIYPSLALGRLARRRPGPDFQILGGPRDGTYAELVVRARGQRLPEARTALVGGGGSVAARRADGLPGALLARRPARRGDGARARRGQRRLHLRRAARGPGGCARARHLVVGREDRAVGGARRRGRRQLRDGGLGRCGARSSAAPISSSTRSARPGRSRSTACARGPRRRLRRHGRHRGDAARATVLLRPVVAARHDDGQPGGLRGAARRARVGLVATGDRLGRAARGGRRGG